MLNKLIKTEFKSTARIFPLMFGALLLVTGINKIFLLIQVDYSENQFLATILNSFQSMGILLYVASIFAVGAATYFIIVQRFYKNLLSDEGYLMFTLPVKPWQLILSKLITAIVWSLAAIVVILLSLFIIFLGPDTINVIRDFFEEIIGQLKSWDFNIALIVIELAISGLVTLIYSITMFYASMSLGQLAKKHRILASIGAYIAINFAIQTLSSLSLIFYPMFVNSIAGFTWFHVIINIYTVFMLALSVGFFLTSNFVLSKKLNLE